MKEFKTFRELPVGALFRFKDGKEIMEKFNATTCSFRYAQDGLYPVKLDAEVLELSGDCSTFSPLRDLEDY